MKPVFILTLLLSSLLACSSPAKKDPVVSPATAEAVTPNFSEEELVRRYESFVSGIDSTKAESVSLAAEKFAEMFSHSSSATCDKAYMSFENLYEKVYNSLNDEIINNEKLQETPCYQTDENGKELPMDKILRKFLDKIEKHGFRLGCDEGFPIVEMERSFVKKHFYNAVSPGMKTYLTQIDSENNEQFSYDAGIVISEKEFVDRTVFWEKFISANPDFPFLDVAKAKYKNLLTYLFIGMDNTPSIGFDTEGGVYNYISVNDLDEYYVSAYTYLNTKYRNSETNKLVASFFTAAKMKDVDKINKLLNSYMKQDKIIDFETEFGME